MGASVMAADLVERRVEDGVLVELRRRGVAYDVVCDGRVAMSSDVRRCEDSLAELVLAPWQGRSDISVLLCGLGMGFGLRSILATPGVVRVDVAECSSALLSWQDRYFAALNGGVAHDPRVHLHHAEVGAFLRADRPGDAGLPADGWFVIIVDTDEWPTYVTYPGNRAFYTEAGLDVFEAALRPGGVLGMWTTVRDDELHLHLNARWQSVLKVAVPVTVEGGSGLEHVYRARRGPRRALN